MKGATKGGFGSKKESMDFTEFLSSTRHPLYEKEGELPKCPPGYRYDKEMKMCVPKSPKDAVGNSQKYGDKDLKPGNGAGYNTWGSSGYDGGYAWEERPTGNDVMGGDMSEEKDACYHKVKSRYSVWPSAYASGALVKCRQKGAANWGNSSKKKD